MYGSEINEWFSAVTGTACSLVRMINNTTGSVSSASTSTPTPSPSSPAFASSVSSFSPSRVSGVRRHRSNAQRKKPEQQHLQQNQPILPPNNQNNFSGDSSPSCPIRYSNESQFLIICSASLQFLNNVIASNYATNDITANKVGCENPVKNADGSAPMLTVSAETFRPNLVVETLVAFEEDSWESLYIVSNNNGGKQSNLRRTGYFHVSSTFTCLYCCLPWYFCACGVWCRERKSECMTMSLQVIGPCNRCRMICIDQRSGRSHPHHEPLRTLSQIRRKQHSNCATSSRPGAIEFGIHADFVFSFDFNNSNNASNSQYIFVHTGDLLRHTKELNVARNP